MTSEDVSKIINEIQVHRLGLLQGPKNVQYSGRTDRLANFDDIAVILQLFMKYMPEGRVIGDYQSDVAFILMLKHFVRFMKILATFDGTFQGDGRSTTTKEILLEVVGDIENYFDLAVANMVEDGMTEWE